MQTWETQSVSAPSLYDTILEMLLDGDNVDIIYLDFAKAFDKVDLGHLLIKIRALGISGQLGNWISSFILDRKQAVKVGSTTSDWQEVISGVPQGTVLGPLLFLIYIDDLGGDLDPQEGLLLKFVDDSKIVKRISKEEDVGDFQVMLNKLYKWQDTNNMVYNASKFQLIRLCFNQEIKDKTTILASNLTQNITPIRGC